MNQAELGGLILAGGHSRRMGQDKAHLPLGSETMLTRVVRRVAQVCRPVVIVTAASQTLPAGLDAEHVHDQFADRGPLEGLRQGLAALSHRCSRAFVASCDVPLIRPDVICLLSDQLGTHDVCLPRVAGREHPLTAVYRTDLHEVLDRRIAAGQLRLLDLLKELDVHWPTEESLRAVDPGLDSLRNINTPEDYRQVAAAIRDFGSATE